jgi:tripartite-type tricarboxylate transporter receptor subunit TctC
MMLVGPCTQSLLAQDYPQKTIRLIVPYPPGGTADMLARTIGQEMAERLGQQIIIDNRPGAGGTAEQLAAFRRIEAPRWGKIVTDSGARVE